MKLITKSYEQAKLKSKKWLSKFTINFLKWLLIIGLSYVILYPIIQLIVPALTYITEVDDPAVIWLPSNPTIKNFKVAMQLLGYWRTLGITFLYTSIIVILQVFVASIVGFGFARFDFPGKKILLVILLLTIAIPYFSIELSTKYYYTNFSLFGLVKLFNNGNTINLLGKNYVYIIINLLGQGLKGGLFVYIFIKFYSNVPVELEESALIDGASYFRIYKDIILPNALPAVITCVVLSFVWNYGDYQNSTLFNYESNFSLMSTVINRNIVRTTNISAFIKNEYGIPGGSINDYMVGAIQNCAILLFMLPLMIVYLVIQRKFVESFERSGIVG